MRFRNDRLKELGDTDGKNDIVKKEWEKMTEEDLKKLKEDVDK